MLIQLVDGSINIIIEPYNRMFRKVIGNVKEDHIDVAIQGLRDMYILGEQVGYAMGTDQARKLPLYLREVLTGEQGKMLQDDEKKSVAYT